MTWSISWEGPAAQYDPDFLKTNGKPGPVAYAAREAVWDAVQAVAEKTPQAWVTISASGWEQVGEPGLGSFNLQVAIAAEMPNSTEGAPTPTPPEPASSASEGAPDA